MPVPSPIGKTWRPAAGGPALGYASPTEPRRSPKRSPAMTTRRRRESSSRRSLLGARGRPVLGRRRGAVGNGWRRCQRDRGRKRCGDRRRRRDRRHGGQSGHGRVRLLWRQPGRRWRHRRGRNSWCRRQRNGGRRGLERRRRRAGLGRTRRKSGGRRRRRRAAWRQRGAFHLPGRRDLRQSAGRDRRRQSIAAPNDPPGTYFGFIEGPIWIASVGGGTRSSPTTSRRRRSSS